MDISIEELFEKIDFLIDFIERYRFLGEVHMVEFFTKSHFENLVSSETQKILINKTISNIRKVVDCSIDINTCVTENDNDLQVVGNLYNFKQWASKTHLQNLNVLCKVEEIREKFSEHDHLSRNNDLSSFVTTKEYMNQKKSHEIEQISPLINLMCSICNSNSIIDVGSGKGYLSSYLSLCYQLKVIGIDFNSHNSSGALFRADKFHQYWQKHLGNKFNMDSANLDMRFKPVTAKVDEATKLDDFDKTEENFVICGLHTCGDLCGNAISLFLKEPKLLGLCVVGCCYHHLTESSDSKDQKVNDFGFPLSDFIQKKGFQLGRNNRMISMQAFQRQTDEIEKDMETSSEKSLFYRALLSVILQDKFHLNPSDKNLRIGKVFSKSKSFVDYIRKSLKKLNLKEDLLTDKEIDFYLHTYKPKLKSLIAFNVLRQLYAPAVESLIVLDKFCYLKEAEKKIHRSFLVEIFNRSLSPRCYAFVALKQCLSELGCKH